MVIWFVMDMIISLWFDISITNPSILGYRWLSHLDRWLDPLRQHLEQPPHARLARLRRASAAWHGRLKGNPGEIRGKSVGTVENLGKFREKMS